MVVCPGFQIESGVGMAPPNYVQDTVAFAEYLICSTFVPHNDIAVLVSLLLYGS